MRKSAPGTRLFWLLALGTAMVTAGCSFIPPYQRPEAPVAASYPAYPGPGDAASSVAQRSTDSLGPRPASGLAWQDFFEDAKLRNLIELALAHNRDLRVAVLTIEQARAQSQIRRAEQFPGVNGVISGSRTPGANGGTSSLYTVGLLTTAYELDFFGRVSSLKEAALSQYLASDEGRKTIHISLIAAVANGYLSILASDELLDITRQTLASREESIKLSKLRFDHGVTSELDYRQAESLLEAARVAYAQQQRQRALDENALTLLVGRPLADELPPVAPVREAEIANVPFLGALAGGSARRSERSVASHTSEEQRRNAPGSAAKNGILAFSASLSAQAPLLAQTRPMADVPAGLPSELLTNRPDIRQAEQLLLAANANIGAARAAFFPRISLTVGAGSASNQLSGLLKSGSWGLTLAPQLVLPIFDAGRNQAGLETARAARDIAVAQYEKSIQTAFREVADALAARATLSEQLRAQQAQANAESIRLRLSDLRYQNGVASYLDLLDAQRSLFTARQAVVQTRLAQLQSQVTLYKALGGGWTEPVAAGVSLSGAPAARP